LVPGAWARSNRARDTRLGREVAIKVLPADVASSPARLARFEREARAVAGLNHPNIVTLHTVEDHDGVRFLTMELVEGQTLSTLILPGGLPLPRLLELAVPLTDALVAAHEKGVIHRDLKPGNVMVTREGRVKVLDFGPRENGGRGYAIRPGRNARGHGGHAGHG
jgi:eukaryotic-like serine/threonine-protein kinase